MARGGYIDVHSLIQCQNSRCGRLYTTCATHRLHGIILAEALLMENAPT
jgi:hypothetical protein